MPGAIDIHSALVIPAIRWAISMTSVVSRVVFAIILKDNQYPINDAAATGLGIALTAASTGKATKATYISKFKDLYHIELVDMIPCRSLSSPREYESIV